MAKNIYVGVSDVACKVSKAYVGVSGTARKIIKGYVGVNGVAQQFYSATNYTQLAYIESSGTQYIDTGIRPYKTTTEITFSMPSQPSSTGYISACYGANDNRYYVCAYAITYTGMPHNSIITAKPNNDGIYLSSYNSNTHTIIYNNQNNKVLFDNAEKGTVTDLTTQITNTLFLFARSNINVQPVEYISARIYAVKITDKATNTLLRDFIPVLDPNNVACLFDKVSNTFFYNQGTGTFSYGTL